MVPALLAALISAQAIHRCDVKLAGQRLQHRWRHIQRVAQEGAEVTDSAKLNGEAQAVVLTSLACDALQIDIIEMEVAAYFSPSWTPFQTDRGRHFSVIVDDGGGAQVIF